MNFQCILDPYACLMYVASYVLKAEKGMSDLLRNAAKEVETQPVRPQLRKCGSVFLKNRQMSGQEGYNTLHLPLRMCSRKVIFVNISPPESRTGLLLPSKILEDKDDDDHDVCCKNMRDRYIARPESLEDLTC